MTGLRILRSDRPRLSVLILGAVWVCLPGCGTPAGRYFGSRAWDLADILPVGLKYGAGLSASARVSPFLQTGLGIHLAKAEGMRADKRGFNWMDHSVQLLLTTYQRDEWRDYYREQGNTLFVLPCVWDDLRDPPFAWVKLPPWHTWLNAEVDIFGGVVGFRIGFAPGELVDFVAGVVGLDPLEDDLKEKDARAAPESAPDGQAGVPRCGFNHEGP